jgi:hypothetical protein
MSTVLLLVDVTSTNCGGSDEMVLSPLGTAVVVSTAVGVGSFVGGIQLIKTITIKHPTSLKILLHISHLRF